ncbi:MAG: glycoside hydrolase family 13 protein [Anaerolineae bacterium]|nr:glycoside hydrolase family 13 protein [Anaerolineae bacterium]
MSSAITPEWVKHAVFYQIFPDRFAQSSRVAKPSNLEKWDTPPTTYGFKGGDLLGVVEKLDHLVALGINAIYFTPIFQSTANHRYHTQDYYQIDPILGGNAAFQTLLAEAHRRGIRVVVDGVFNHASRGFYQFNHALENGKESPYLDWFYFHGFPVNAYHDKANYECWWGIPALPKLNTNTAAVREFIFDVAEYWIKAGADGWRLDVPAEINDDSFWQEFRRRVKAVNPEAYIVGEIWHDAHRWLQGDQFDAVMNYVFTKACLGFFARDQQDGKLTEGTGLSPVPLNARQFADEVQRMLGMYDQNIVQVQMNLLDSHDTARYLQFAKGDVKALELATLFQMTFTGAPSIYYGDEIGLMGGKDPDSRRTFPWDEQQWNQSLLAYFKQCVALRNAHPALRTGDFRLLHAEGDVIAYARTLGEAAFVVVLNASYADVTLDVPLGAMLGGRYQACFGGDSQVDATAGMLQGIRLAPRTGLVLTRHA